LIIPKIFKNSTISIVTILLLANWLIDKNIIAKFKTGFTNKFFLFSLLYWTLHVIGIFYSANTHDAKFVVEKKLSLLLFPIIFATINLNQESKLRIFKWFLHLLIFFSSSCIAYGLYNYLKTGDIKQLGLENTLFINIHRVVMSMYLTLGVYFSLELYKNKQIKPYTLLLYFSIATIHILLMASRLYLAVYFVFGYYLAYKFIVNHKTFYKLSAIGAVVFVLTTTLLFNTNRQFKEQICTVLAGRQTDVARTNGVSERTYIWEASFNLIERHPIIGIGQGDIVDSLVNEYHKMNWSVGIINKYHCHNQYLQSFVGLGIFGLTALILFIFYPFVFFKQTGTEAKICSVLFGISLMTDNHTELQQSIIFMTLWLSIFINLKKEETTT
jgi:O-antigen ligase